MLALLAGPGLSAHHVFTQRLHLVRVSGARFYKYIRGIHTTQGRVYIIHTGRVRVNSLFYESLVRVFFTGLSCWLCLAECDALWGSLCWRRCRSWRLRPSTQEQLYSEMPAAAGTATEVWCVLTFRMNALIYVHNHIKLIFIQCIKMFTQRSWRTFIRSSLHLLS